MLDRHGIPSAPFRVIGPDEPSEKASKNVLESLTSYPLFAKLVTEGSSMGIGNFNKMNSSTELQPAIQELQSMFPGRAIMIETFLSGREFTVSILGTGRDSRIIGVREHLWRDGDEGGRDHITQDYVNRKDKSSKGDGLMFNDCHDMEDPQIKAACRVSLDAWKAFACRDAGRVDIRLDTDKPDSVPNVLEVGTVLSRLDAFS